MVSTTWPPALLVAPGYQDMSATSGEGGSSGPPDTTGRSGDQRNLAVHVHLNS
jgi:hypothetical protein